jgi:hypothetical protein
MTPSSSNEVSGHPGRLNPFGGRGRGLLGGKRARVGDGCVSRAVGKLANEEPTSSTPTGDLGPGGGVQRGLAALEVQLRSHDGGDVLPVGRRRQPSTSWSFRWSACVCSTKTHALRRTPVCPPRVQARTAEGSR